MARIAWRVVVANDCVGLEGARAPIMDIIPGHIPPGDDQRQERPQHQHNDHPKPQIQQWVHTQDTSLPHTSSLETRRFRARATGGSARRGLLIFLRVLWVETRSALRNWS